MSHEVTIHIAQTAILRELLFHPAAGFSELREPTGLSSDHFSFHINRLVELGLVEKTGQRGRYRLTTKGKEYANRLDTDNNTVERQPKVAVLLAIERFHEGERQLLFQQRLKQPYFGYWGLPSGKLRWGETIVDGAARELLEETGLIAKLEIKGVYHEHATNAESGELLEDKVFFVIRCTEPIGTLTTEFEGGANSWMSVEEARGQAKVFGSFDTEIDIADGKGVFVEDSYAIPTEEF
jgi:ADP-ribose pyrophosphatase YjhB (NUDIX family)/predicted transcriptional regulator